MSLARSPPRRSPRLQSTESPSLGEVSPSSTPAGESDILVSTVPTVSLTTPLASVVATITTTNVPLPPHSAAGLQQNGVPSYVLTSANATNLPPTVPVAQNEIASLRGQIQSLQTQLLEAMRVINSPFTTSGVCTANSSSSVSSELGLSQGNIQNIVTQPLPPPAEQSSNGQQRLHPYYTHAAPPQFMNKIYDLPEFSGSPEDWPMFSSAFQHSTAAYQYSSFENCLRLQKALKGEAKESVKSLLIHPNNVSVIMEQLKLQYGRPELLIHTQLQQIRDIASISESCVEKLIPLSIKVQNFAAFLHSAGGYLHLSNPTLMEELIQKLPMSKRLEWAQYASTLGYAPTVVDFGKWLQVVASLIRSVQSTSRPSSDAKRKLVLHTSDSQSKKSVCPKCSGEHKIIDCKKFAALSVPNRWSEAKKLKLCFSCLSCGHSSRNCHNKSQCPADGCKRNHNKLLHEDRKVSCNTSTASVEPALSLATSVEPVLSCVSSVNKKAELLFRVLPVKLYSENCVVETYALLDEGSSVTMMDSALVRQLKLQGKKSNLNLSWYGGKSSEETAVVVDMHVSGAGKNRKYALRNVYGVPNLKLPVQSFNADPMKDYGVPIGSYENVVPTILIGLEHCHLGLPDEIVPLENDGPYAAHTPLGWVVFGKLNGTGHFNKTCLFAAQPEQMLCDMMTDYFEIENFGVKALPDLESSDDLRAKQILKAATKKVDGRYQSRLLWCDDDVVLPDSYSMAFNRLLGMERKMRKNVDFAAAYKSIIRDYVKKRYVHKILPSDRTNVSPRNWFLPHFGVFNPNKPGKLRLVFDAAATVEGISLNSKLLKGPQQQRPLPTILFSFRVGAVGVCGDIREMFHQVLVAPEDRCSQRFLWREDETQSPDVYEMRVMTCGAACSPCIAQYVRDSNALEFRDRYPRAVKAILENHYVDDFVDSFETVSKAIDVTKQVKEIHAAAGYELRHFTSNSVKVVAALQGNESKLVSFSSEIQNLHETEKILGMFWNPADDAFKFQLNFHRVKTAIIEGKMYPTKRELLSLVMSIFDPIGILCHFMISAKLLLREVWRSDVRWDEMLPIHLHDKWNAWRSDLQNVPRVSVPRWYFKNEPPGSLELHTFVDASEDAFGAVSYWRWSGADGYVGVSFVAAKTKCAPMKSMTIPRLELQAAVLGTRLMCTILKEHSLKVERAVCWSDSTTVISWIRSESRKYKPFVAHRIAEILDSTRPTDWKWLPSSYNVADETTRMKNNVDFSCEARWFQGPQFLHNKEDWPKPPSSMSDENCAEELRPKFALLVSKNAIIDFNRFSSFLKLKRTIAFVLRFGKRRSKQQSARHGPTAEELKEAEVVICRIAQEESFAEEIRSLKSGRSLTKNSELSSLLPYFDEDSLLRVYGRIKAASWLPLESRHQIILPLNHPLSGLIVFNAHKEMKHQNFEATVGEIRRKFWILGVRKSLRKCIANCPFCKVRRAIPRQPLMGSLPADRLSPYIRPFSYTGLDYFGPVNVTIGRRQEKRWVALFVCLTVRAIHLEVAFHLSTDACILAIRNFINRRGTPTKIRTDNGKNFVGANQVAKQFDEVFDVSKIQGELSKRGVQWQFSCPHNPAEGGSWERMVQCVKKVLRVTMKEVAPREYTFQSLIIEAENIVNSRPLTYLPVGHEDEEPLTPNHFVIGSANTAQTPAGDVSNKPAVLRKQWRISRQLRDHFWKRWIVEYLPDLTRRSKWCEYTRPMAPGDLVLICDPNVGRREWKRGRVQRLFKGTDDVVRRAEVQTSTGTLMRPISKLAVLDVIGGSEEIHGGGDVAKCS